MNSVDKLIKLWPHALHENSYYVFFNENRIFLGEIYQEIDGEWVFDRNRELTGIESWPVMLAIARKLMKLNGVCYGETLHQDGQIEPR